MNDLFSWQMLLFLIPLGFGGLLAVGAALGLVAAGGEDGLHEGGSGAVEPGGDMVAEPGEGGWLASGGLAQSHTEAVHALAAEVSLLAGETAHGGSLDAGGAAHGGLLDAGGAAHGGLLDAGGAAHGGLLDAGGAAVPLTVRLMVWSLGFGGLGLTLQPLSHAAWPGAGAAPTALAAGMAAAGSFGLARLVRRIFRRHVPLLQSEIVRRAELVGRQGRLVLPAATDRGLVQLRDRRGNLHQAPCRLTGAEGNAGLPSGTRVLLVDYDQGRGLFLVTRDPLLE